MLQVDSQTGLCLQATYIPSPNQDERPDGMQPELIVVHGISLPPNQFGGEAITQLFTNALNPQDDPYFATICGLKVSAHMLIRRDGSLLQYVPFQQRAWHAGLSAYQGRNRCNDFSIGIELEGTDCGAYSATQYRLLAELIKALWRAYPSLSHEAVVGHSDIAPGRKTDPGPYFQWQALWRLLENPQRA
ncbi:1,6-anhydro-N-acetylmuramyl-L-alanine amidase AmpD [Thiomicrorhabdus cannonii]|uniref:1,6-anhydro-N-acetylmuramyl-L-alanine amidase AmpD n=1 Tax=Thiomicrorhabdus cannonii TaxID=2748011 RepID=UPI0015B87410